jgi:hypothetical protein
MVTGACGLRGALVPGNVTKENAHEPGIATTLHREMAASRVWEKLWTFPLALKEDATVVRKLRRTLYCYTELRLTFKSLHSNIFHMEIKNTCSQQSLHNRISLC